MGVLSNLILRCEDALKTFNPITHTLDAFTSDLLGCAEGESAPAESVFIKQVLYGCVRYKHALKMAITSFYFCNSSKASRSDYTKYMILGYLAIFRIEDLGFEEFKRIVYSQQSKKMHVFLTYLFNKDNLETHIKDQWMKLYDLSFVEEKMIGKILEYVPQVEDLCEDLSRLAFAVIQKREESDKSTDVPSILAKPPTIPQPFNLTQPRPFVVPEPMKISQGIKAKPVPKNLNNVTLEAIEAQRIKGKQDIFEETQAKHDSFASLQFKLHTTKDTITKLIEKKEKQIERVLSRKFVANEVPDFNKHQAQIHMNLAAILKEDALYKKKQEQEANLLKAYESELRDSTEFYEWQKKKRKEDEINRLKLVDKRRQDSATSAQEAKLATEKQLAYNKSVAQKLKLESKMIKQNLEEDTAEHVENKRSLVKSVHARKSIPAEEKEKLFRKKQRLRKSMISQQKKREAEKREKDRIELEKRIDLIRQIRAFERVPVVNVKQFDPTARQGHGLLEELSLMELKERLAINQKREAEIEKERREKIIKEKKERQKDLQLRIQVIQRARKAAAEENRKHRLAKKGREIQRRKLEEETKTTNKIILAEKLAEIRAERVKEIQLLKEEERKLQKMRMFLGAAKNMVEEKVHEEFLKGAERQARNRQTTKQIDAKLVEEIRERENKIRTENQRYEAIQKRAKELATTTKIQAAKKASKEASYTKMKEKKTIVNKERKNYADICAKNAKINQYKTDMMSQLPIRLIKNMGKHEMLRFYEGKPNDLKLAVSDLFDGRKTFDPSRDETATNFATTASAVNSMFNKIHDK